MKAADFFTFGSMAFGVLTVFSLMKGFPFIAAVFMLLAVLADFLDGKVARKLKESDEFGKYLDSLADIVVFGMVPVVVALLLAAREWYLVVASVWFLCAGAFRLARYMRRKKAVFEGMPITVNGVVTAGLILFTPETWVFAAYFILSGVLMVATFEVRKL